MRLLVLVLTPVTACCLVYLYIRLSVIKVYKTRIYKTRVVTLSSIKEHITPILNDLHWLTIHNRIKFKLLLLTYKVFNGFAPTYLSELIQPYKNQRNLRSNNQYLLRVPKSRTTTFGDRAFSVFQGYGTIYQLTLNLHHR